MRIVVDAMGSDNHPGPDVAGAVMAAREFGDTLILVGDQALIEERLAQESTAGLKLDVVHASQAITMEDKPSRVVREKRDSSMHVGVNLVKNGDADAFVTAGNTGGALGVSMLRGVGLGRLPGVKRPALGALFPTRERPMLIDIGANADCRPEHLLQFAIMGSHYVQLMRGIERPRIGLISNGEEEGKGNQLIQEAVPLLTAANLNYVGNIEPKEFMGGEVEVGVADGFTGNILMKTAEATASAMSATLRREIKAGFLTSIGGLLARPAFGRMRDEMDSERVGGAILLGLNGVVIVAHGRSNARAMKQAVFQARSMVENGVIEAIAHGIREQS